MDLTLGLISSIVYIILKRNQKRIQLFPSLSVPNQTVKNISTNFTWSAWCWSSIRWRDTIWYWNRNINVKMIFVLLNYQLTFNFFNGFGNGWPRCWKLFIIKSNSMFDAIFTVIRKRLNMWIVIIGCSASKLSPII